MRSIAYQVNEDGQLVGAVLHDGHIVGLEYQEEQILSLRVRRVDGSCVQLAFRGVGRFGCQWFLDGAIIGDVFIWDPRRVPEHHAFSNMGVWAALSGYGSDVARLSGTMRSALELGKRWVVFIANVYGGNMGVLCDEIEVIEL